MSPIEKLSFVLPTSVKNGDSFNLTIVHYTAKLIEYPITHDDDIVGYITGDKGTYAIMFNVNAERLAGQVAHIVFPEED